MSEEPRIHFAYGSNMSVRRLQARVPSAKSLGIGTLDDHQLMFRKKSRDGSTKCDIAPSKGCTVLGVLFWIDPGEEERLDKFEGLGSGYRKEQVLVADRAGQRVPATTYFAQNEHIDTTLKPYTWYLKHVLTGAEEAELPACYIDDLKRVESVADPNPKREKNELAIYQSNG